jgi:hypothetical protein
MFCQKCGKEIMDEAVVCIHCGCATSKSNTGSSAPTNDIIAIREFASRVKTAKIWGIVTLILMFGIAIIPGFINLYFIKNTKIPVVTTTNPLELSEFEAAKKAMQTAETLTKIGTAVNLIIWSFSLGMLPFIFM